MPLDLTPDSIPEPDNDLPGSDAGPTDPPEDGIVADGEPDEHADDEHDEDDEDDDGVEDHNSGGDHGADHA